MKGLVVIVNGIKCGLETGLSSSESHSQARIVLDTQRQRPWMQGQKWTPWALWGGSGSTSKGGSGASIKT